MQNDILVAYCYLANVLPKSSGLKFKWIRNKQITHSLWLALDSTRSLLSVSVLNSRIYTVRVSGMGIVCPLDHPR